MHRRDFLSAVTVSAGGMFVAGLAPASMLEASSSCVPVVPGHDDPCGDWTLDDMCGAYPPYAFRTGPAVPHTKPSQAGVTNADWHWLA